MGISATMLVGGGPGSGNPAVAGFPAVAPSVGAGFPVISGHNSPSVTPGQRVPLTLSLMNPGVLPLNVQAIQPFCYVHGTTQAVPSAQFGLWALGPGMSSTIPAGGVPLQLQGEMVLFGHPLNAGGQQAGASAGQAPVYDIGANVTTSDGVTVQAVMTSVVVGGGF